MKNILKTITSAAATLAAAAVMTFTAAAQDYEFDVSEAKPSDGQWGQTFIYYTGLDEGTAIDFDPTTITVDSIVIAEYESEGTGDRCPIELIFQTWEGGAAESEKNIWAKIAPYEYDETTAKFNYENIINKYGSEDLSSVYAINVGDTGLGAVTLKKLTVTNVSDGSAAAETEAETEAETQAEETEEVTEAETEPEETEAEETEASEEETTAEETTVTEAETTEKETAKETTAAEAVEETSAATTIDYAANAPTENGAGPVIVVIIVVLAVAGIAAVIVMLLKKNNGKFY